jgi:hypothetical protein
VSRRRRDEEFLRGTDIRWQEFVEVAGPVVNSTAETDAIAENADHFWITIDAEPFGPLRISISTASRANRAAGYDDRMRLAVLKTNWTTLPQCGVRRCQRVSYADITTSGVTFGVIGRIALEQLLSEKVARARFAQAWGELYLRNGLGIHQVHSRSASFGIRRNVRGRDGALKLFFDGGSAETLLFKYAGQA